VSDPKSDHRDPVLGDPEGEWNDVVRRISDRIRRKGSGGPTTQTGLDVAGELVRLDRRAREAEASLERERGAYALRVQEMEDKLKKVEPWLRQVKSEYQKASAERDRLRDELARGTRNGSPETVAVEKDEKTRAVSLREAEAARVERDAALAEASNLRKRFESQKSSADAAAEVRIAAAETARDQAAEDLDQMRKTAGDGRRADEEVKRLLKQVEQLETTTSAHKAVARAAQDTADQLQARIAGIEKAAHEAQAKAESAQQHADRARDLAGKLEETGIELAAARRKVADAESVAAAVRGGEAAVRRELEARVRELESARAELDRARKSVEKLGAESAGVRSQLAEVRRESQSRAAETARRSAALDAAKAAGQQARDDGASAARDATEAQELADEAMRAEQEARARSDDLAARLASAEQQIASAAASAQDFSERIESEQQARERAESRATELDARATANAARVRDLEPELELARGRAQALESEVGDRARAFEQQAQDAARRFESAESSFRSQMRAAEARFEMDLHRERERARSAEEASRVLEERNACALVEFDAEVTRLRSTTMQFLGAKTHELVEGMQRIVGEEPIVVPPITMSMENPRTPTATVAVLPPAGIETPSPATGEWDRLMSDVEQLCSEVEDMRQETGEKPADTDSVSVEVTVPMPGPAPSPAEVDESDSATQPDPDVDPLANTVEMPPRFAQQNSGGGHARRGRKKRR
jgi:chromosome segregation ATPase